MKRALHIAFIIFVSSILNQVFAQEKTMPRSFETPQETVNIYPNPVTNGKLFISSKSNVHSREVYIFDVLGKVVFQQETSTKELNISSLNPGVYMIKIREKDTYTTRKLIVK